MTRTHITLRIEDNLLAALDEHVSKQVDLSRSEAIRGWITQGLEARGALGKVAA